MSESVMMPGWLKWISFGVDSGVPFTQRRKVYVTNGVAMTSLFLSVAYGIANACRSELIHLLPYNLILAFVSMVTLALSWRGFPQMGYSLQWAVGIVIFYLTSILYFNGSENFMLVSIGATVFVIDRRILRLCMVFVSGLAFACVKLEQYDAYSWDRVPLDRYGLNIAIVIMGYCVFMELFRLLLDRYVERIESNNKVLAQQQAELNEERSRLLTANAAKEKLFSMVAHDFRGPVGNLQLALESVEDGSLDAGEFQQMRLELKTGVDRVYASLDDLLHWAAGQMEAIEPDFQSLELRKIAQETLDLLEASASSKRIELQNELDCEIWVRADRHQLGTILRNFVANAIKFTPGGGSVKLSAERRKEEWVVAVTDTGVGIGSKTLMDLFDTDLTKPSRGTHDEKGWGLGLQICRDFVEANGGTIRVESVPGNGTTFFFTLGVADLAPEIEQTI